MGRKGVIVDEILGFTLPRKACEPKLKLTKNQRYPVKMCGIPQGMHLTLNIVPFLTKMTYNNHDLLAYLECTTEPFDLQQQGDGGHVTRVPQQWAVGLQRLGLLGLTNMPHFG